MHWFHAWSSRATPATHSSLGYCGTSDLSPRNAKRTRTGTALLAGREKRHKEKRSLSTSASAPTLQPPPPIFANVERLRFCLPPTGFCCCYSGFKHQHRHNLFLFPYRAHDRPLIPVVPEQARQAPDSPGMAPKAVKDDPSHTRPRQATPPPRRGPCLLPSKTRSASAPRPGLLMALSIRSI